MNDFPLFDFFGNRKTTNNDNSVDSTINITDGGLVVDVLEAVQDSQAEGYAFAQNIVSQGLAITKSEAAQNAAQRNEIVRQSIPFIAAAIVAWAYINRG
ncbi:MAG: hypothetical protein K8953_05250 [Proteobacteria bacterium]|nr:hypothetical protein [Pseudomonadota bacterium]